MNYPTNKKKGVNHTKNVWFYPFFFNGKEKDYESGFHYYGARYYWSELLTGWLSVDPMADKYPSLSPYSYCVWNPVKLVDPEGMDTIFSFACKTNDSQYNERNKRILDAMRNIGDNPQILAIAAHGDPNKIVLSKITEGSKTEDVNANELAEMIEKGSFGAFLYKNNKKKNEQTIIVLYACRTGDGDDCFAQQLSEQLDHSIVIAPAGSVWTGINEKKQTTIDNRMAIRTGIKEIPYIKGICRSWNIFCKGEKVMSFCKSAPQAWIRKQGGINNVIKDVTKQYGQKN